MTGGSSHRSRIRYEPPERLDPRERILLAVDGEMDEGDAVVELERRVPKSVGLVTRASSA